MSARGSGGDHASPLGRCARRSARAFAAVSTTVRASRRIIPAKGNLDAVPKARTDAVPKARSKEGGRRTQRTRSEILAAAEQLFARRGYAVTRMEDVADAVELTRTALFYHFRDKLSLYEAVIENAFAAFEERLRTALSADSPPAARIERSADLWIEALVERPTLARLLIWHVASGEESPTHSMFRASDQILGAALKLYEQGRADGALKPKHDDPLFAASTVIGTTVIYLSALTSLTPAGVADAVGAQQLLAHKKDILALARRLLGITSAPRATTTRGSAGKKKR
jgi:TetR/AcrR family transcriptional regulator